MSSEMKSAPSTRLILHHSTLSHPESNFADDVRAGLTGHPKTLKPKYFYDALGSHLFEAICHLPEYYLTRAETEIFKRYGREITGRIAGPVSLVELGSGSATKTRYLIEALLARQPYLHYQPIDISATMLQQSAHELLKDYPTLRITAWAGDYTKGLSFIERREAGSLMVLFLGSNIGNYDPPEAIKLLKTVRQVLHDGDGLLLGADLKKDPAMLEAAYNDALGVTAAFNLNLLLRINRELEADFNLAQFEHRANYNQARGRIEMNLVSRCAQIINIRRIALQVEMKEGERIHTENSYKYDHQQLAALAEEAGFKSDRMWFDDDKRFSCNLWLVC